jgi:hypothetical protein
VSENSQNLGQNKKNGKRKGNQQKIMEIGNNIWD